MRTRALGTCVVGLLLLTGCSAHTPAHETPTPSPIVTNERTNVDWDAYPSDTKQIIDEEQAAGDCEALQDMFDVADNAGFLDQMKYIDEALGLAGCYD